MSATENGRAHSVDDRDGGRTTAGGVRIAPRPVLRPDYEKAWGRSVPMVQP